MKKVVLFIMVLAMVIGVVACSNPASKAETTTAEKLSTESTTVESSEVTTKVSAFDLVVNAPKESKTVDEINKEFGDVPKPSKAYKIGAVVKSLEGSHWQEVARGYKELAEELGVTIDIQGGATEGDLTGQQAIAESMIEKNYDVLLLSPISASNLDPAIEKAIGKSIPIVNVDFEIINEKFPYIHVVGMKDFTPEGKWVAEWFAENLPEGSKVAHIEGLGGAIAANQRKAGFVDTVKSMGKLILVSSQPGDWNREKAYNITTNIITQNPDLAAIYCANDGMALGSVQAVIASGKDIMVFGTDGIPEAIAEIKKGTMTGTVSAFPYFLGTGGLGAAIRLLEGQQLPQNITTKVAIVTGSNVLEYYPN